MAISGINGTQSGQDAAFAASLQSFSGGLDIGNAIGTFITARAEGKVRDQIAQFNAKIKERNALEASQNAEFQAGLIENQAITDQQFIQFQIDLTKAESKAELIDNAFRLHSARLANKRIVANQRSKTSGAGLAIGGSALEIMSETAGVLEMGVLEIQRDSRIKQQGLEREIALLEREEVGTIAAARTEAELTRRAGGIRSTDLRTSARFTRATGRLARTAANIEGTTALLTGASRFTSNFTRFRRETQA